MFTIPVLRFWPRVSSARVCPDLRQSRYCNPIAVARASARFQNKAGPLAANAADAGDAVKPPRPEYELTFTCKPCLTRSTHRVSKQAYHYGSVCVACPACKNRHVISDHLNFFSEQNVTIEDIMQNQGQLVKKGRLSEDGTFEVWDDGTYTKRNAQ